MQVHSLLYESEATEGGQGWKHFTTVIRHHVFDGVILSCPSLSADHLPADV